MPSNYDAVVIGAGPAGSMAAYEIASAGYSVLLLEKHKTPGTPLCCAEAVSRPSFERILHLRQEWIAASIDRVRIVAPSGDEVNLFSPNIGYILERKRLDRDLAEQATKAGADLKCEAIGLELVRTGNLFKSLKIIRKNNQMADIQAKIFIAADGVESKIARQAGFDNTIDGGDIEALFQYRLEEIAIDPTKVEFFVGNEIAPGSYIWVFPKSSSSANVGLGVSIGPRTGKQAQVLLQQFIYKRFGKAVIQETVCGLVPRYQGERMFQLANLLVVGDAARAVDSLSGAGIVNAMLSGKYAGIAAAKYISGRIENIDQIKELYPGRFLQEKGEELIMYTRLRQIYNRLDDKDFNDIVLALRDYLSKNSITGISAGKILAGIIKTRPRLLRLAKYLA
ncbi:MAG: NAD(P)/FAD-dependent oxidoreductase [candidate division Zixibacteria bacterium]|nr:NAD(P)/FAD-dependent oxidoreductase [candidate division Zixibacteria bacterium]